MRIRRAVFEGPEAPLRGWRHYQIFHNGKTHTCTNRATAASGMAAQLQAKFYPAGTWEAVPALAGRFPCPSQKVLGELSGIEQPELMAA